MDASRENECVLALTLVVYAFIFVFGLVGNLRVIYSVLRHKSNRTVVNVFMSNLSVANVFLCLIVLPIFPVILMTKSWPLGEFVCHLWPFVNHSLCYASMLTLTSIGLFRCWTIVHSCEDTRTTTKLIGIFSFIWSMSMLISLPRGIYKVLIEIEHTGENSTYLCQSRWPSDSFKDNYLITTFIIMILVPLIAIVCCFIDIASKISYLSTEIQEHARTNRLIIMMAVVFGVCWMPINIYELVPDAHKYRNSDTAIGVVDVMAVSSTCFTPLFYAWLNHMTIKQLLLHGPCCNHTSNRSNNEEVGTADATSQTYDNAVTYNAEVDTVDMALPTYEDVVTPPPTYAVAITYLYYTNHQCCPDET